MITAFHPFQPKFEDANVTFVSCGHDHNYQHDRKNGIDHYVHGGAGLYDPLEHSNNADTFNFEIVKTERTFHYEVVDVSSDQLILTAKRLGDDSIIEQVSYAPRFGGTSISTSTGTSTSTSSGTSTSTAQGGFLLDDYEGGDLVNVNGGDVGTWQGSGGIASAQWTGSYSHKPCGIKSRMPEPAAGSSKR